MPRLNSDEKKLALLERIGESKHILFNNNVKKQEKLDKWREIYNFAREDLKYWVPETALFTYLRDAVWPNMRNAALLKRKKIRADMTIDIIDDPSKFDLYFSPLEQKIFEIVSYYDSDVLDFSKTIKIEDYSYTTASNFIKKEISSEIEAERETPKSCFETGNSLNGVLGIEAESSMNGAAFDIADGGSSENETSSQKGENTNSNNNQNAEIHQKTQIYDSTVNNFIRNLKRKRVSGNHDFESEKKQLHVEMLRLQNEKLRKELRLMEIQECKALLELRILEKQLNQE